MAHFYILYSQNRNRYYIGHTAALPEERLRKHNTNHKGFTGSNSDWKIVYAEVHSSKELACAREREVKRWKSRRLIEKLVGSEHPDI